MTAGQGQAAAGTAAPQREEAAPAAGASGATGGEATAAAAPLKKPAGDWPGRRRGSRADWPVRGGARIE